jgi:hypothetical protein
MKKTCFVLSSIAVAMSVGSASHAALLANDSAADAVYASSWTNGQNGGTGFGAWTVSPNPNNGTGGFFVGSSTFNDAGSTTTNINTAGRSWGAYANSGTIAAAVRPLTGTLDVNQSILASFDNGSIISGNSLGMGLRSGTTNIVEVFFAGGASSYSIAIPGNPIFNTAIPFSRGGLDLTFSATGANTMTVSILSKATGVTSTFPLTVPNTTTIDNIRLFNGNARGATSNTPAGDFDGYFNSLAVVPEPTTLAALAGLSVLVLRRRK